MEDISSFEPTALDLVDDIRSVFLAGTAIQVVASSMGINQEALEDEAQAKSNTLLELTSGVVILLNAVVVGMSVDVHPLWPGWSGCEIFFTVFFLSELIYKLKSDGCRKHFSGDDKMWNIFDCIIVVLAATDLTITLLSTPFEIDLRAFTTIRLIRLARLTRLVRILRLKAFKELLLMVKGLFIGTRTLVWAIMLLMFLIYCLGILIKQTIGSETWTGWGDCGAELHDCSASELYIHKHKDQLFSTVFRSMFTVFRCFMDGCSAPDGTPLMVHVLNVYGPMTTILYVMVVLSVTFGLFNLTMAIFVENTLEAAKYDEARRQQARHKEYIHGAQTLKDLIMEFCQTLPRYNSSSAVLSVDASLFAKIVSEPRVLKQLNEMDIDTPNKKDLFEVLDADQSGTVDLKELVLGLMKLRGYASKADGVATLLSLRSLHRTVKLSEIHLTRQLTCLRSSVSELSKLCHSFQGCKEPTKHNL